MLYCLGNGREFLVLSASLVATVCQDPTIYAFLFLNSCMFVIILFHPSMTAVQAAESSVFQSF